MPKVVTIVFEGNHKKYYFGAIPNLEVEKLAVVETARGIEVGKIVSGEMDIPDEDVIGELKMVIRQATDEDCQAYYQNRALMPSLYDEVKEILKNHKELEMKLLEVTYTLDRSKLIIYFSSEGRVDFRELVKEIAFKYHTRIELRQVGPRDASRIISGIGECGRVTCCSEWLGDIQNVTIKMAKNQNLSLNPTAISGLCGKLLCCIAFEDELYQERAKLNEESLEETGLEEVISSNESIENLEELKALVEDDVQEPKKPIRENKPNNNRYEYKPKTDYKNESSKEDDTKDRQSSNNNQKRKNSNNNNGNNHNKPNNNKNHFNNKNNRNNKPNNKNHFNKSNRNNNSNDDDEEVVRIEV